MIVDATLTSVIVTAARLTAPLRVVQAMDEDPGWMDQAALAAPDAFPLNAVLARAAAPELGETQSRKAASAWFILRAGWACGASIAAYLALDRVLQVEAFALKLPVGRQPGTVCLQSATIVAVNGVDAAGHRKAARAALLHAVVNQVEAIVESQHGWSGLGRGAMWGLITSSWASHFVHMGQQLGDEQRGRREAEAVFALLAHTHRAAPRLFTVSSGELQGVCQVRRSCCRNHRRIGGVHCSSCPLLDDEVRMTRYEQWVTVRPLRRVEGLSFLAGGGEP
ncbi:MAG: hypothetical protein JWQ11_92 [Rhizobacter sp.]|nr:hypothetical protein [Rhizobacter sp.]